MTAGLNGRRVAMLVTNGFEQSELEVPKRELEAAGARVDIVSLKKDRVKAWDYTEWGKEFDIDAHIEQASVADYDGLVLPGGVMNPDYLRLDERAVAFAGDFVRQGKPVGAVCHGAWTLVEADVVRGRTMTSYPSLKTDLRNAGANWVDQEVCVDENLVTSRRPDDLPAFCRELIRVLGQREHGRSAAE